MSKLFSKAKVSVETIVVIALFLIVPFVFSFIVWWTDNTLDFWASYVKGQEINVPLWISIILALLFMPVVFLLDLLSEIMKYFI